MPQATDELRAYWGGVDDAPALRHLEARGFTLNGDWTWTPPPGLTWDTMTERDRLAVEFLVDEWDFGGLCP